MCSEHLLRSIPQLFIVRFSLLFDSKLFSNFKCFSLLPCRLFWKYIVWFLNVWELCNISLLLVSGLIPCSFHSFSLYSLIPCSAGTQFWEMLWSLCCYGSKCLVMLHSAQVSLSVPLGNVLSLLVCPWILTAFASLILYLSCCMRAYSGLFHL